MNSNLLLSRAQSCLWICCWMSWGLAAYGESSLSIIPSNLQLTGPNSHQQLVLEQITDQDMAGQTTNVTYASLNTNVVVVHGDIAVPVGNGQTKITVQNGACRTVAEVTGAGMDKPVEGRFRNNVQPVLAKAGCNAGACHGAAAGQNGFKLSLRGYDDEGDFLALTHQALGRRIIPSDPGRSLLLLKPTAAVPHKGGKRFDVDSLDYRVLSGWIAAGAPGPKSDDPRIARIEILPKQVVLGPNAAQQLSVRAHFNDGHTEDVTRWTKYTSANETVSQVDDLGEVKVVGFGEGAITAWYLSRIDIATVTVPYTNHLAK